MAPIPANLKEELDWINAYFHLVRHKRAQTQDQPAIQPVACPGVPSNPDLRGHKRAHDQLVDSPSTALPPHPISTSPAPSTMTSALDTSGLITLEGFEAQHDGLRSVVPIPLGKPRSSEHVQELFRLAQARRITPLFEFGEPVVQKFVVKLTFGTLVIEDDGPFSSKKEAKESVCQRALEVLKATTEASGKGEADGDATAVPQEPWVAVLNNWTQVAGCPVPSYQEFALGSSFACEVTVSKRVEPFGSRNIGFANKKAARLNAAQEAVLWLREQGLCDTDGPARKKQKTQNSSSPVPIATLPEVKEKQFVQQVIDLCQTIDLRAPDYQITPSADAPAFYSGHAVFTHAPGSFQDKQMGKVRHVRGRVAAKEACAKQVLAFLEEHIQTSRAKLERDLEARTAKRKLEWLGDGDDDDVPSVQRFVAHTADADETIGSLLDI